MSIQWKYRCQQFKKKHVSIRVTTYFIVAYVLYSLILGVLAPYVAKGQIPHQLSKLTGREVQLDEISINPFTLNLQLSHFVVLEGENAFVGFEKLEVEVNFWQSLWNMAIAVEHLNLVKPFGHIERLSGTPDTFNFSDINTTINRQLPINSNEVIDEEKTSAPLQVMISSVNLQQGNFTFIDKVTGGELHYPNVNFTVGNVNTATDINNPKQQQNNLFQIDIEDSKQARFLLNGQFQVSPLAIIGAVDVQQFDLPTAWMFIAQAFAVELNHGKLNIESDYQFTLNDDNQLEFITTNGEFELEDIQIDAASESIVSLPLLKLEGISIDLIDKRVIIESLNSNGLILNSKIDHSGLDLATLFTPTFAEKESSEALEKTKTKDDIGLDWFLSLKSMQIDNYQFNVKEKLVTNKELSWSLQAIDLSTSELVSDLSKPFDIELSASLNQKGSIAIQGAVDPKKETVEAAVDIKSLQLSQFQPYVAKAINATLQRGDLSTQINVKADSSGDVLANGALKIEKLAIKDNVLNKSLVKWQKLTVDKFNFNLAKSTLALNTVTIDQPYATVIVAENKETNISQLMIEQPESESSDPNTPFQVTINRIEFDGGAAFFADNSLTPNFSTSIESLEGAVTHISSVPGTKAVVDVKGNIDRYAPVSITGEINPLIEQPFVDLNLNFKSVELTSVNPYSGTYAGYYIDKGQLSVTLNYLLEHNQLTGSNHVVIDQLELGKASDSDLATSLPLSLAIALLQDNNGVIDLGVEVTGDVDDPDFSIGSVIMNAIVNVITKAVTAPFSLLAGLTDSDAELNHVSFDFGQASLSEDEKQKLMQLGDALASRPKLKLTVDGAVNAHEDSKVLAINQLNNKLIQIAKLDESSLSQRITPSTVSENDQLAAALITLYQGELNNEAAEVKITITKEQQDKGVELTDTELSTRWYLTMYNLLLNHQQISEDQLGQLAHQRAKRVKTYLIENVNISVDRVFLLDSRFDIEQDDSGVVLTLEAN
ncbi:MAG: DUF748 domain-containing protein [Aliivibrio sp.]|uniref:DUF748 domain-containing protein n=1 Tax=Aliivibrio sp. TaxID=1872443 RepID=UPI001A560F6C|nr:DUF748 domain-containing protein [Aliivibrio sp.]